jgi:DMSO/TMAO reductase YedYZ heme-binding membrane subunit
MKAPEPYLVWRDPAPADDAAHAPVVLAKPQINRWLRNGLLLTVLFIALPPLPYVVSPLWTLALLTGYAAAALIAILMLLPLRRLAGWPHARISVERHKKLGELALVLALAHTLLLLIGETLTLEYIWPSQPYYMIAGNAGLVLLALLVVTSLERVRVAVFGPRLRFRPIHVGAAVILVVLVAAHMAGSGIFVAHPLKAAVVAILSAILIVMSFWRPDEKSEPARADGTQEARTS